MLTWIYWFISLASPLYGYWYISTQEKLEAMSIAREPWYIYLLIMLLVIVLTEIFITLALKKYLLIVPARKHKYDSNDYLGSLIFFCVHSINFFLATTIAIYGIVLYIQTVNYIYISIGVGIWLSLMIYHLPRKIYKPLIKQA